MDIVINGTYNIFKKRKKTLDKYLLFAGLSNLVREFQIEGTSTEIATRVDLNLLSRFFLSESWVEDPDDANQGPAHLVLDGGGVFCRLFLSDQDLTPGFDYDFTNIKDILSFKRGNETYLRPTGWMKYALNIDRYHVQDGNEDWFGDKNGSKEWPVSYHSVGINTGDINSLGTLAKDGHRSLKLKGYTSGRGCYSTPNILLAEKYASTFTHQDIEYLIMFQSRVNPNSLLKNPKSINDEFWVNKITNNNYSDIRTYGVLIKKK